MRPIKTLTPADLTIRGLFVAAVAIGGLVGRNQQSSATPSPGGAPNQVAMAGIVTGGLSPESAACRSADTATAVPASASQRGDSYQLRGIVRSRASCTPVGGATIEFWSGGAQAAKSGGRHASLHADANGSYRLHCNLPAGDSGGSDYIYLRVSADGYTPSETQYQLKDGQAEDWLDIVLEPEE